MIKNVVLVNLVHSVSMYEFSRGIVSTHSGSDHVFVGLSRSGNGLGDLSSTKKVLVGVFNVSFLTENGIRGPQWSLPADSSSKIV